VRQLRALLRHRVALVWRRTRLCIRNHAIVADMVMTGRAAGTGAARAGPGPPGGAGYFSRAARQRRAGLGIEDAGCGLAAVVPGDSPRRDAAAQVGDGRQQARAGHGLAGVGGAQQPGRQRSAVLDPVPPAAGDVVAACPARGQRDGDRGHGRDPAPGGGQAGRAIVVAPPAAAGQHVGRPAAGPSAMRCGHACCLPGPGGGAFPRDGKQRAATGRLSSFRKIDELADGPACAGRPDGAEP